MVALDVQVMTDVLVLLQIKSNILVGVLGEAEQDAVRPRRLAVAAESAVDINC